MLDTFERSQLRLKQCSDEERMIFKLDDADFAVLINSRDAQRTGFKKRTVVRIEAKFTIDVPTKLGMKRQSISAKVNV